MDEAFEEEKRLFEIDKKWRKKKEAKEKNEAEADLDYLKWQQRRANKPPDFPEE